MEIQSFGISTSAMLATLSISCWTARKLDKRVSEEIDVTKNAKARVGNYHKHLLAGAKALDALTKYTARVRLWNTQNTLPWSDNGARLVPSSYLIEYKTGVSEHERNWNALLDAFLAEYPNSVSASAFVLGDLFNRDEYPPVELIRSKFSFNFSLDLIPNSGDFRVDIAEDAKREIIEQMNVRAEQRLNDAMREAWSRLHECLTHMSERLENDEDGERKKFHGTLVSNSVELCGLLTKFNITNDPQLELARRELASALTNVDYSSLKESDELRLQTKSKVDSILSKFEW
jgi:hypothetical protein